MPTDTPIAPLAAAAASYPAVAPRAASSTAAGCAALRAIHQHHDGAPLILTDPIAERLLSPAQLAAAVADASTPFSLALRAHVVTRSRFAEDTLAAALADPARGITQVVILGAGFDTLAYRQRDSGGDGASWAGTTFIEVDHPASQAAKRAALETGCVPIPPNVHYLPIDLAATPLAAALASCPQFNGSAPTFFVWLGVIMYLSHADGEAVLRERGFSDARIAALREAGVMLGD